MKNNKTDEIKMPLVSVIISVFNEEKYIRESISCILNQTYKNLEIIIIDDYCTDNSITILNEFMDPRIILYKKTNEQRFLATSRNIGINLAKGEYIILHDADETCSNDRIEKQLNKAIELNGNVVVGCCVNKIYPDGNIIKMNLPTKHEEIIKGFTRIRNRVTIVSGTILASRSIFEQFKYNESLKFMQDWDHMLRIYESGVVQFSNISEYLYNYYQRPKNVGLNPDWPDYNILIRFNQKRRKYGKTEFKNIIELKNHLQKNTIDRIFWGIFRAILAINIKLKNKI